MTKMQSKEIKLRRGETLEVTHRENGQRVLDEVRGPAILTIWRPRKQPAGKGY